MTDKSKKAPVLNQKEDLTIPVLEFDTGSNDLQIERKSSVIQEVDSALEVKSDTGDIVLSFESDNLDSIIESNVMPHKSKNNTETGSNLGILFSDSAHLDTPFVKDEISEVLFADLKAFESTRKSIKIPESLKENSGTMEFLIQEDVEVHTVINKAPSLIENIIHEQPVQDTDENEFSYASNDEEVLTDKSFNLDSEIESINITPQAELNTNPVVSHRLETDYRAEVEIQATIRQIRLERDDLLKQLKEIKSANRDLEQDNLTLKSALDESKIEISIFRKRNMTELEDLKYRLAISEDKKILAEEKAKAFASQKEKLEQKVRIDISQVRQREKELETKLEMISIDVDAQVNSRDQKILELRRKIDSLEFNMENVSIREQKTTEDKRKIEDKLNKVMKTLRNSIKNLEEDVESEISPNRELFNGKNK